MSETPEPTPQPSPNAKRNWKATIYIIVLTALIVIWLFQPVSDKEKPQWTYLIPVMPALAGLCVAYFAYLQFLKGYEQRERDHREQVRQFEAKVETERNQFEARIQIERNHFEEKVEADKIQFERKLLEEQFNDIQNRLSDGNAAIRANAALRLAQLAEAVNPSSNPEEYTFESRPYFTRAVSQLAIAVNVEKDAGVCSAIAKGVSNIIAFAKRASNNILLEFLIITLVEATRTSTNQLISASAKFLAIQIWQQDNPSNEKYKNLSIVVALFGENFELCEDVLKRLMSPFDSLREFTVTAFIFQNHLDESRQSDMVSETIYEAQAAGDKFLIVRDLLTRALPRKNEKNRIHFDYLFDGIFLVGANLINVDLQGASLIGADLTGANLKLANLQDACLQEAKLQEADLRQAELQSTQFPEAQFQDTDLRWANLQKANLHKAQLQGAKVSNNQFV